MPCQNNLLNRNHTSKAPKAEWKISQRNLKCGDPWNLKSALIVQFSRNQIHFNRHGTPRGNQKHWKEKFYPATFAKSTIIIDCNDSDKAAASNQFNSLIKAELFDSFWGETFCNLGLSYHLRSVNGFWCFCGAIFLWSFQMKTNKLSHKSQVP